jgi:hypothetical protein
MSGREPPDVEQLRDRIAICLDDGDLDSAGACLDELVAIAQAGGSDAALHLSIADFAQRLGDSRAERKLIPGAIAGYHLALQELRAIGAGADEVNQRMDKAATSLCSLFRNRLQVRNMLPGIRQVLKDAEHATPQQAEEMGADVAAELLADPDREICHWFNWRPEAIEAFELAASVYTDLMEWDAPRYRPEAARIRMELARKLQTSTDTAERSKVADMARLASRDYLILRRDDNAKYLPLAAEALHLASNMHWKLRRHDRLQVDAKKALAFYFEMGRPADAGEMERIVLLAETLAWSYQHTRQPPHAVRILEELLPFCRKVALTDPLKAEPFLADLLHALGLACMFAEEEEKAEQALSEAVRLSRKLAALDGQAHAELLSSVLELYANLRSDTGRWDLAFDLEAEARRWKNKKFLVS